jgi:3-dehydroquinate dehydratase / shikimate dehydrogenase
VTHLCVAILARTLEQTKREIATAVAADADMVELRLDAYHGYPLEEEIQWLLANTLMPCIITLRPVWEGGHSESADEDRLHQLASIGAMEKVAYVDVELKTYLRRNDLALSPEAMFLIRAVPEKKREALILSSHDFTGRPDRLYNVIAELNAASCDVNKIVWMARTIRDNLEAFEILQQRQRPTIALCMGEPGLISRVLAKKFGAFLTFASLEDGTGTAPGQISLRDMKRLYRWDAINARTKVYGVVASPVAHSMSPAIHNAAFGETGHDGVYLPLLVNPGYESFKAFMESFVNFEGLDLSGLSVTLPHKENALRHLKEKGAEIEPLAERIGAVNTVIIDRSSGAPVLRGMNTDYAAILDSITDNLVITHEALADYRIAVIGAGGTGRTAVAALAHFGATVVVYNRTKDRADALAAEFNGQTGKVVAAPLEKLCDSCCQIYINTSSVGMHPNVGASPFGEQPPKLTPEMLVFDTVYNPPKTKLLQQAQAAGAKTVGGVEMFVRQAAAQFEAWTGLTAPAQTMRRVVEQRLAQ